MFIATIDEIRYIVPVWSHGGVGILDFFLMVIVRRIVLAIFFSAASSYTLMIRWLPAMSTRLFKYFLCQLGYLNVFS
jgi:hypothetical protein